MARFVWPAELDDARRLLTVVGSFWAETYAGSDLVASLLHAKAQQQAQAQLDLYELLASFSRFKIPVFHKENWSLLRLEESKVNSSNLPKFDGTYDFESGITFDTPVATSVFAWPAPAGLVKADVISDRITEANFTWTRGVDFTVENGEIRFLVNPFSLEAANPVQTFEDGKSGDRVLYLWVYSGEYDWDTTYKQFGYVLDLRLKSSRNYKALMNAAFDCVVEGTSARRIEEFMSAVCDVPLARGTEMVKYVLADLRSQWVITDTNVYEFSPHAAVTVAPGTMLTAGQALADPLVFYEFNQGKLPTDIKAIVAGSGLLSAAFFQELVFENKSVPLIVEENVKGYTKVSFQISGWPGDIEKFWDDVHAAGIAKGATLAMAMDTRETKTGQPTALALPQSVNPAEFLIANIFRGNAFAIVVRPQAFGPEALGLHAATSLRRYVPPQTLCLLFVEHGHTETVAMEGSGSETAPGYNEDVSTFLGETLTEILDPAAYVTEELKVFQIEGYCS